MRKSQSGNIFFWILLMIALFAALSYAMMQSSRTGSSTVDKEKAHMAASELFTYTNEVYQGIRALLISGCTPGQLSFANAAMAPAYNNPASPIDKRCHLFDPAGAGVGIQLPPAVLLDGTSGAEYGNYIFSSEIYITDVGTAAYPNRGDLMMLIPYVNATMCKEINRRQDIDTKWDPAEDDLSHSIVTGLAKFNGSFTHMTSRNIDGFATWGYAGEFWRGKRAGCTQTSDGKYLFFYVLLPN